MRLNCFLLFYSIKKNMFQRTRLGHFTPILSPEKLCFTAGMFLASIQAGCFHSERLMSCSDSTSWSKLCYRRQTSVRQLIKQSTSRWALSQAIPFNLTISSSTLSQVILPRYPAHIFGMQIQHVNYNCMQVQYKFILSSSILCVIYYLNTHPRVHLFSQKAVIDDIG